jgi:hypothetical protein
MVHPQVRWGGFNWRVAQALLCKLLSMLLAAPPCSHHLLPAATLPSGVASNDCTTAYIAPSTLLCLYLWHGLGAETMSQQTAPASELAPLVSSASCLLVLSDSFGCVFVR